MPGGNNGATSNSGGNRGKKSLSKSGVQLTGCHSTLRGLHNVLSNLGFRWPLRLPIEKAV